jgi:hypothetical protein
MMFAVVSFSTVSYADDHTWGTYHWARTANLFKLLVVDSVTSDWDTELDTALYEWSASEVLDLEITDFNDSKKTRRRCRMINGQIRVCNDSYGYNGWLGLATIGIDTNGHIDRGTAKVNDSYSSYWEIVGEKNHVMCQEIGHLFGLGHTSEDGSSQQTCMDYSSDPLSQWPNQGDYDLLLGIYGHVDAYNSYAGAVADGGDGGSSGCNAPPGKGCNKNNPVADIPPRGVRVNQSRNAEVWVAPRNDGGLWIHHIRLVPSEYDVLKDSDK